MVQVLFLLREHGKISRCEVAGNSFLSVDFYSLSNAEEISELRFEKCMISSSFSSLGMPSHLNIKKIMFNGHSKTDNGNIQDFDGIEVLANSLEEFICSYYYKIEDFSAIGKLTNLKRLEIQNTELSDISFLSTLKNVEYLILCNNSITKLKSIENLDKLTYLDVRNNLIYDTSTYTDENGNNVVYKNLQILADLYNKNASFRRLIISGNTGITDYSLISGLSWTTKDF